MKVHIDSNFLTREYAIYFYETGPTKTHLYRWLAETWHVEEVRQGAEFEKPSLTLPREALEELVRAATGHVHAQDATVRHLDDVTGTRDRLLSLIEKRGIR